MKEIFEPYDRLKDKIDPLESKGFNKFREVAKPGIETEQALDPKEGKTDEGKWVDTGIQDVPVDKIDDSDTYVNSTDDFHKVSHEEMVRGFNTLQSDVRPAVEKGADVEHFRKLDQQRGLEYENGTQRVYEAFYGKDAVRLDKVGDRYLATNGFHRIYVAKELGLATIPARVIEKRI
jgi:hypothetical protein